MKGIRATSLSIILSLLVGCNNAANNFALIPPAISNKPIEYSIIRTNDGVGFINKSGKVVVQPKYSDVKPFSDGLAAVEVAQESGEKLWGFINNKGEFVIKPQYVIVNSFADKLALVLPKDGTRKVFIDRRGNVAISHQKSWRFAASFSEGLAPVTSKGKWGYIDITGKIVIEPKFDGVRDFSNGLAFVKIGKGFEALVGYIDRTGRLAVPLKYKGGTDFVSERALVSPGVFASLNLIDKQGNTLKERINVSCSEIKDRFSENLIPARLELPGQAGLLKLDGCGYINAQGNIAIPPDRKFEKAEPFSEGLAPVQMSNKWGFIDKSGKIVIDPKFEEASSFKNGLAYVKVNAAEQGYINHSGQFVWKPVSF